MDDITTVPALMALGARKPMMDHVTLAAQRNEVFSALFSASDNARATTLGRYVVQGTLGCGATGNVLKAFDPQLDRRVAIKVLRKELDIEHSMRLRREAQALAKLSHPNVVQVYEVGEIDGQSFVVMERVKGRTLMEWMHQQARPSWRECVRVFVQIGAGLAAAHEQGLVHRDFKPANAIIDRKGRPRVLDFGLACQARDFESVEQTTKQAPHALGSKRTPLDDPLTGEGVVLGTPAYMSPEQMKGVDADPRSDQFSFCVALYEAVYGERPFGGISMAALMVSIRQREIRSTPEVTRVPRRLRTLLLRGLAFDPDDRWPSMDVLLVELRRLEAPRHRSWLTLGVALGLAGSVLGLWRSTPATGASRCRATQHLEGIWDDARRAEAEAAVLAAAPGDAKATWMDAERRLDEYARAWTTRYVDACEAAVDLDRGSLDMLRARLSCLVTGKAALDVATTGLADANERTIEQALDFVADLPSPPMCHEDTVRRREP